MESHEARAGRRAKLGLGPSDRVPMAPGALEALGRHAEQLGCSLATARRMRREEAHLTVRPVPVGYGEAALDTVRREVAARAGA